MERTADPTAEAWRKRLARQRRSGLSVVEFCRREGVGKASFYAWRKRLSESAEAEPQQPLFVPVELAGVERSSAGVQIELPGGAVVSLPIDASTELVAAAIRTVMQGASGEEGRPC